MNEKQKRILQELNENEFFGLSIGMLPIRYMGLDFSPKEFADLISVAQKKTGVVA